MRLCECGCGNRTTIVRVNKPEHGLVKGQFRRFYRHHRIRTRPGVHYGKREYNGSQDSIHRIRAQQALGKPLPPKAIVHHADGTRDDNAPLVICQDQGYHRFLHARMRIKAAGGNPNTDAICAGCRMVKPRGEFFPRAASAIGVTSLCQICDRKDQSLRRKRVTCMTHVEAMQAQPDNGASA